MAFGFLLIFFENDWTYVKKKKTNKPTKKKLRKLTRERLLPYELKSYHGVRSTYQVVVFLESVVCFLYDALLNTQRSHGMGAGVDWKSGALGISL